MQQISMRSPLDGADVNAVFVHLPQRAQVAQLGHVELDGLDGVINFGLGGPAANRHAQTAVGQLVAATQARST
jgi:hypothetical protein